MSERVSAVPAEGEVDARAEADELDRMDAGEAAMPVHVRRVPRGAPVLVKVAMHVEGHVDRALAHGGHKLRRQRPAGAVLLSARLREERLGSTTRCCSSFDSLILSSASETQSTTRRPSPSRSACTSARYASPSRVGASA